MGIDIREEWFGMTMFFCFVFLFFVVVFFFFFVNFEQRYGPCLTSDFFMLNIL